MKKDGKYLPSILVVASPGAGKDDVPPLLKLYSNCYNRGRIYNLNMASLKPNAVAPVAMVGGEIVREESTTRDMDGINLTFYKEETYKLKGILQKIKKKVQEDFEEFIKSKLGKNINTHKDYIKWRKNKIEEKINEKEQEIKQKDADQKELKEKRNKLNELKNNNLIEVINKIRGIEEISFVDESKAKEWIENYISECDKKINKLNDEKETKERILRELKQERNDLHEKSKKLDKISTKLKSSSDIKLLGSEEKLIVKELFGKFPTIVLDELNSLSIESQGVLLRFLENAEITPIGGYEDKMEEIVNGDEVEKAYREFITDFLIIGVMNEDPEAITREEAIRFLEKEKYIGGLLGDLLYEHIIKVRRLRPDLRSRMMRNGVFEMPKLAEHPADIPVIFYNILNKDKGDYFPNSEIGITMDALELLMSPELEWSENVRLLQTLIKKVEEVLYEDYENKDKDLIIVREKHIRKAMKAIGMEKEEMSRETPI